MMDRATNRKLMIGFALAGLASTSPTFSNKAEAHAGHSETCTMNFDDVTALSRLWLQARYYDGIAYPTNANGQICQRVSNTRTDHPGCNVYQQICAGKEVFAFDQSTNFHMHLIPENPAFRTQPIADYRVPRYASSMPGSWWELGTRDVATNTLSVYNLNTISVGAKPIQLWFKKTDGSVWGWSNLGANTNWYVGGSSNDIVMAWVGPVSADGTFDLNDYQVTVGH